MNVCIEYFAVINMVVTSTAVIAHHHFEHCSQQQHLAQLRCILRLCHSECYVVVIQSALFLQHLYQQLVRFDAWQVGIWQSAVCRIL